MVTAWLLIPLLNSAAIKYLKSLLVASTCSHYSFCAFVFGIRSPRMYCWGAIFVSDITNNFKLWVYQSHAPLRVHTVDKDTNSQSKQGGNWTILTTRASCGAVSTK